jgi:transcriptional regulator with AAA-type ATPase domain
MWSNNIADKFWHQWRSSRHDSSLRTWALARRTNLRVRCSARDVRPCSGVNILLCEKRQRGNVRELETFIERAVILTPDEFCMPSWSRPKMLEEETPAISDPIFHVAERESFVSWETPRGMTAELAGAADKLGFKRTFIMKVTLAALEFLSLLWSLRSRCLSQFLLC